MNYDDLKLSVEAMSGGTNTVILDDLGKPSVMVAIPKMKYSDIIDGGSSSTLPCFIVDGKELDQIWVSKYLNIISDDRAYSLPNRSPKTHVSHDTAVQVCRNKGEGWSLMPSGVWGAILGWCLKNEFLPRGNTNYGASNSHSYEKGIGSGYSTKTGTGPVTWNHDGSTAGISDLVGNLYDMQTGVRLVNGEIQIIPYGNSMKSDCDLSTESTEWRAIMPDGTLVDTGTEGTLHYTIPSSNFIQIDTEPLYSSGGAITSKFSSLSAKEGVAVPEILQAYGLAPIPNRAYGNGFFYITGISGTLVLKRGGTYTGNTQGGLSCMDASTSQTYSHWITGFRSVYYEA